MTEPMPMCPMAETCRGMMRGRFPGFGLFIPGIVLIVLGIAVVFEPRILAWLIAVVLILFGFMMLMMARFVRRVGARFETMDRDGP